MRWISFKTRWPEESDYYLLAGPRHVELSWLDPKDYDPTYNSKAGLLRFEGWTHWMPLPELPKRKE